MPPSFVGNHYLVDAYYRPSDRGVLCDHANFYLNMIVSCEEAGATVISKNYKMFGTEQGYTFLIGLAESHVSCHTWPEYDMACFDIFMCGKSDTKTVFNLFLAKSKIQPLSMVANHIHRGKYNV